LEHFFEGQFNSNGLLFFELGRGKTYTARKMARYLCWINYKVFNTVPGSGKFNAHARIPEHDGSCHAVKNRFQ
jgi:hypothetical protein